MNKFISFLPSQTGSTNQTPLQYTSDPTKLFWADLCLFLGRYKYLLGIPMPLYFGKESEPYDELYLNAKNIKSVVLHTILVIMQLAFLISLPFFVLFPVFWVLAYGVAFYLINHALASLLNGSSIMLVASESCKPVKDRETEYWIYMNGVAIGRDWLQSNIDRLSLTFGRRVNGVLNPTSGIVFDLIQCLVSTKNLTQICYSIINRRYKEIFNMLRMTFEPHMSISKKQCSMRLVFPIQGEFSTIRSDIRIILLSLLRFLTKVY
jgi:hypothetical protein